MFESILTDYLFIELDDDWLGEHIAKCAFWTSSGDDLGWYGEIYNASLLAGKWNWFEDLAWWKWLSDSSSFKLYASEFSDQAIYLPFSSSFLQMGYTEVLFSYI